MLRAEELMVGDWVQNPHGLKGRVRSIKYIPKDNADNYGGYSLLELVFSESTQTFPISVQTFPINDAKSIPLTTEILEKNGFMNGKLNVSPQYCFEEGHTFIGVTLEATPDRQEGIAVCKNRNSLQYEGKIEFVHELQHALRLCGIDKTIEL